MTRVRAVLWRGLCSILARPGRAALAAFGIGIGVAAALQLVGAPAAGSGGAEARPDERPARVPRLMVSNGERESVAAVWAATAADARRAGLRAGEGRMLDDRDLREGRRVAVLGAGLRAELFGFRSGLLETIRIGSSRFTVVGVLEARGASSAPEGANSAPEGRDPDRAIVLPEGAIRAHLAHLVPAADAPRGGGGVRGAAALPSPFAALATVAFLLGGGALALAMLATVIERTQEIALRRAVGASRREVFAELWVESLLVAALGGLAGIAGALAFDRRPAAGAPSELLLWCAPLALAFALMVGAAAGAFPALRAAAIEPVRALRGDATGAGC